MIINRRNKLLSAGVERAMAELIITFYAVIGGLLGLWICCHGPVKPDNMVRASALLCVVLLWPFFVLHTLRS